MAQDRISEISNFLNYREVRRSNRNMTKTKRTLTKIREKGLTDKVVFVSSNLELLEATEQRIKGNVFTILIDPQTLGIRRGNVVPIELCVIIFDKHTPRVDNLMESYKSKGYEVYDY